MNVPAPSGFARCAKMVLNLRGEMWGSRRDRRNPDAWRGAMLIPPLLPWGCKKMGHPVSDFSTRTNCLFGRLRIAVLSFDLELLSLDSSQKNSVAICPGGY